MIQTDPPRPPQVATDLNLYYDVSHLNWDKRPDWFAVVGVPRLYQRDLRLSYVMWQERVKPLIVVEAIAYNCNSELTSSAVLANCA